MAFSNNKIKCASYWFYSLQSYLKLNKNLAVHEEQLANREVRESRQRNKHLVIKVVAANIDRMLHHKLQKRKNYGCWVRKFPKRPSLATLFPS